MALNQRLGPVKTVGVRDQVPERDVAPQRIGDALQRVARLHRVSGGCAWISQPVDRIVALVEVRIRRARRGAIAERPCARYLDVFGDRGRVIDIARPVVRDVAYRHTVEVIMQLARIAGRTVGVRLITLQHLPVQCVDEAHCARTAVRDRNARQIAQTVVAIGRGVGQRSVPDQEDLYNNKLFIFRNLDALLVQCTADSIIAMLSASNEV